MLIFIIKWKFNYIIFIYTYNYSITSTIQIRKYKIFLLTHFNTLFFLYFYKFLFSPTAYYYIFKFVYRYFPSINNNWLIQNIFILQKAFSTIVKYQEKYLLLIQQFWLTRPQRWLYFNRTSVYVYWILR